MDNFPYQMISNLRPQTTLAWKLKVRVTRMWPKINRYGQTIGINLIFVDELGGRIHAWIPAQNMDQLANLITEGETYNVHNFVVREYGATQTYRCFRNDIYIQLYHLTEIFVTGGVDFIPHQVFDFTGLEAIINAALEDTYLIDVVGIMEQEQPIVTFTNKHNQQESCLRFTINDMHFSVPVTFYNELAQSFAQGLRDAVQHPVIVIISSCKSTFHQGEPKLSNFEATRFFINHTDEAVTDLRNALILADWNIN